MLINSYRLRIYTHADTSCAVKNNRMLKIINGPKLDISPFKGLSIKKVSFTKTIVVIDWLDG